jgi:hypothetical protein
METEIVVVGPKGETCENHHQDSRNWVPIVDETTDHRQEESRNG